MYLQNKRIFIVEDNAGTRALIQLLLEQQGAQVIFAEGGTNIITILKDSSPLDMIILDLMLWDGITGHNLNDEIRTLPDFKHVPIVAVSAADPESAIPETKARGFTGFIGKPIEYNLFPQQLAQILDNQEVWHTRN
jgi:CheY-like chemotaxis protein